MNLITSPLTYFYQYITSNTFCNENSVAYKIMEQRCFQEKVEHPMGTIHYIYL